MKLVRDKAKQITDCFAYQSTAVKKMTHFRDMTDDCHFIQPEYTRIPSSGLFVDLEETEEEEMYLRMLEIYNFYHHLHLSKPLRTSFFCCRFTWKNTENSSGRS